MAIKDEISAAVRAMVKQAVNFGPGGMAMVTNEDGIPIPYTDNTLIRNGGNGGTPITVGGAKREYGWQKYRDHATKTLGYDPVSKMRREALLVPVRMVEEGVLGATGAVGGAMAGVADAGNNYGWGSFVGAGRRPGAFSDAWSHVGNVAAGAAKEMTRPETVNHFNGMLGSAAANTAYNFLPGIVGVVSDKGAQKVRDAQDAIGLGGVRDYADSVRNRAEEAAFRRWYGDKGWEDYVQNPEAFAKSHPEVALSQAAETVGRKSLNMAAGFKGFGTASKALQPLKRVKGIGQMFKHPIATSAAVGTASGIKDGIESGSVVHGLKTGLESAGATTLLLGGNPWIGGGEMIAGQGVEVGSKYSDYLQAPELNDEDRETLRRDGLSQGDRLATMFAAQSEDYRRSPKNIAAYMYSSYTLGTLRPEYAYLIQQLARDGYLDRGTAIKMLTSIQTTMDK